LPTISPNTFNQNFEIAILFNVVKRPENYVFENDNPTTALGASALSYALAVFKVCIERVSDREIFGGGSLDW